MAYRYTGNIDTHFGYLKSNFWVLNSTYFENTLDTQLILVFA
jgi:hypothetical protein